MDQSVINLLNSLYVVRGVVRGLRRTEGYVNDLTSRERHSAAGAAMGAAITGNATGAVGGMQSVGHKGREVTFFNCKIGQIPVSGYFQTSNFEDGDEVEAVISSFTEGGIHECVAVARPEDRVLWTRGVGQGRNVERKKRALFLGCFLSAIYVFFVIASLFSNIPNSTTFALLVGAPICLVLAIVLFFTEPQSHKEIRAIEQRCLELLGFERPEWVDIKKQHAFYEPVRPGETGNVRFPLCYDAFRYDTIRILDHEVVDAEMPMRR